jgi:hypothetical protein
MADERRLAGRNRSPQEREGADRGSSIAERSQGSPSTAAREAQARCRSRGALQTVSSGRSILDGGGMEEHD